MEEAAVKSDNPFPFLIGNKFDLIQGGAPRAVDDATVQRFANDLMTNPLHVSATTGFGCEEAFKAITDFLIKNAKASRKAAVGEEDEKSSAPPPKTQQKKKCFC